MLFVKVGQVIGATFKLQCQRFVETYDNLHEVLYPFYNTEQGKQVVERFESTARSMYPQYYEELEGLVNGTEVDYTTVCCRQH